MNPDQKIAEIEELLDEFEDWSDYEYILDVQDEIYPEDADSEIIRKTLELVAEDMRTILCDHENTERRIKCLITDQDAVVCSDCGTVLDVVER